MELLVWKDVLNINDISIMFFKILRLEGIKISHSLGKLFTYLAYQIHMRTCLTNIFKFIEFIFKMSVINDMLNSLIKPVD